MRLRVLLSPTGAQFVNQVLHDKCAHFALQGVVHIWIRRSGSHFASLTSAHFALPTGINFVK